MPGTIDTFGCPEFFVDATEIETVGGNVRMSFGIRRRERVQGVFSMVVPADVAMIWARACQQVSEAAFNALAMIEEKPRTH